MTVHASPSEYQLSDLRRLYRYDRKLGCVISRTTNLPVTKNNGYYIQLRFGGRTAVAQKAVWYFVKGSWPNFDLDHKDTVKTNNRITNLRPTTPGLNCQNQITAKANNKTGFLGVHPHLGRFRATIQVNGVSHCLGVHKTPEAAHSAYVKAKRKLHPFGML